MTSPKLRELSEKKKWLIKDGNYHRALEVNNQLQSEVKRLETNNERKVYRSVDKKIEAMQKKN